MHIQKYRYKWTPSTSFLRLFYFHTMNIEQNTVLPEYLPVITKFNDKT